MYKQLIAHKKYVIGQIATLSSDETKQKMLQYHLERVKDFQHERLIHLLVTFFFAFLMLGSLTAWLVVPLPELRWPLGLLSLLLFVLEMAYIHHYYQLENGVQSLYELTEELGKIC